MVRIKLGQRGDIYPFYSMLHSQIFIVVIHVDQGIICDRNHSFARVTINAAKGSYLTHIQIVKSSQFIHSTVGSIIDALVRGDEASVETPFAASGIHLSPAYQYLQFPFIETKDNAVYRDP